MEGTVHGIICKSIATVLGADRRGKTDAEKSILHGIECAVMSGSDSKPYSIAKAVRQWNGKSVSLRTLGPRLSKAKVRAQGNVDEWGTVTRKRRHDSMVGNAAVEDIFARVWRDGSVRPADKIYLNQNEPGRREYKGRNSGNKRYKPSGNERPIERRDINLTSKTAAEVSNKINNSPELIKEISAALKRQVASVGARTCAELRPWDVKPLCPRHRLTCVCLSHTQARNMYVRFLNEVEKAHTNCVCCCGVCRPSGKLTDPCCAMDRFPPTVSEYIDNSACARKTVDFGLGGDFVASLHDPACVNRTCKTCQGTVTKLAPCEEKHNSGPAGISLRTFQMAAEVKKKKKDEAAAKIQNAWRIRPVRYDSLAELKTALDDVIDDPNSKDNSGSDSFRKHRFKNHYLHASEPVMFSDMMPEDLYVEIDYAMAIGLNSLEDIQQQFMNGQVITCVTVVVKYLGDDGKLVKEEIALVSDHRAQDSCMTECVTRKLMAIFAKRGRIIKNVIFKSDNCKVQFKSAENYNDMYEWTHSCVALFDGTEMKVMTMVRCFGVAMHGKCECDSLGALIGATVQKARLNNLTVDCAAHIVSLFQTRTDNASGYVGTKTKFAKLTVVEITAAEYNVVAKEREGKSYSMGGKTGANQFHQVVAEGSLVKGPRAKNMTVNEPIATVHSRQDVFCLCGGCRARFGMSTKIGRENSKQCYARQFTTPWATATINSPIPVENVQLTCPTFAVGAPRIMTARGVKVKVPPGTAAGGCFSAKLPIGKDKVGTEQEEEQDQEEQEQEREQEQEQEQEQEEQQEHQHQHQEHQEHQELEGGEALPFRVRTKPADEG